MDHHDHHEHHRDRAHRAAVEAAFVQGFRSAADKLGFLALTRIPLELEMPEGLGLKLVEVVLEDTIEVGRTSLGFASRELVYQPLPAPLVTERVRLAFRYVSAEGSREFSLVELLSGELSAVSYQPSAIKY